MDKTVIEYIANLSRIDLSEEEKVFFIHQLSNIISYIEKLNRLNTEDIEPMSHAIISSNVFRGDEPVVSILREEALSNAPSKIGFFVKVPKVID